MVTFDVLRIVVADLRAVTSAFVRPADYSSRSHEFGQYQFERRYLLLTGPV
jgi:hypothetical protein